MARVDVPVGIRADRWTTVKPERIVLAIAHNVTTVTRLLDVLPAFDSDPRIQLVASWNGADPFQHGLRELLDDMGIVTISWDQARHTRFDLAIAASHHGDLTEITAPLAILSHGMGYTKIRPGIRESGNPGIRESGNPGTFGLSPQWVLHDGEPVADAFVLSHDEQLTRLAAAAPAAVPAAVIAGDPCHDRLLASRDHRDRYRAALGSGQRTVVLVSSTWWSNSLLGSWPDLIRRLLAELDADSFQVVAALHPNIWHGHGPWQVRSWLADCVRSGLILLPEVDGWRAGLIAADVVIGDHGSVTGYGAALGRPTLLAAFPAESVPAGSPIAALGAAAPRLDQATPLGPQVESAIGDHDPDRYAGVASMVTSAPGESLALLRSLFYRLLGLSEPEHDVPVEPVPPTGVRPPPVSAFEVAVEVAGRVVRLVRRPAEVQRRRVGLRAPEPTGDVHVVCPVDHPVRGLRAAAAVLTCRRDDLPGDWAATTLARNPSCTVAAVLDDHRCLAVPRGESTVELSATGVDPASLASIVYGWLGVGGRMTDLAPGVTLDIGGRHLPVRIEIR